MVFTSTTNTSTTASPYLYNATHFIINIIHRQNTKLVFIGIYTLLGLFEILEGRVPYLIRWGGDVQADQA